MRYHEIASGVRLHVSFEEQAILDKIGDKDIARCDLDERDQEVARLMVSRGLLKRFKKDDEIMFKASSLDEVWRERW